MKILEKILEEIEKHAIEFESFGMCDDYVSVGWVKEIIRSKMDKIPKCGECSRRKWYQKGYEDGRKDNGWIPVETKLPEDDRYILLSFENFSLPLVGRYEENEKGGAFYLGDCDEEDTCISNDLYVNAWTYLPEGCKVSDKARERFRRKPYSIKKEVTDHDRS